MDDSVGRLIWALPLVLLIGIGVLLALKKLGVGTGLNHAVNGDPIVRGMTLLSEQTKVTVVEVWGRAYMVVESSTGLHVEALDAQRAGFPSRPLAAWRGKPH